MSLQRISTVPQPQHVLVWLSSKVQSGGEKNEKDAEKKQYKEVRRFNNI